MFLKFATVIAAVIIVGYGFTFLYFTFEPTISAMLSALVP